MDFKIYLILMPTFCFLHTELEMLGSLQNELLLCLLVKNGLGLSSETHLFRVVTAFSLRKIGGFSGLILGNLVNGVLAAFFALAEGFALFRYIHHFYVFFDLFFDVLGKMIEHQTSAIF